MFLRSLHIYGITVARVYEMIKPFMGATGAGKTHLRSGDSASVYSGPSGKAVVEDGETSKGLLRTG